MFLLSLLLLIYFYLSLFILFFLSWFLCIFLLICVSLECNFFYFYPASLPLSHLPALPLSLSLSLLVSLPICLLLILHFFLSSLVGVVSRCSGGEDARCANQWIWLENIGDHLVYLGTVLYCIVLYYSKLLSNFYTYPYFQCFHYSTHCFCPFFSLFISFCRESLSFSFPLSLSDSLSLSLSLWLSLSLSLSLSLWLSLSILSFLALYTSLLLYAHLSICLPLYDF